MDHELKKPHGNTGKKHAAKASRKKYFRVNFGCTEDELVTLKKMMLVKKNSDYLKAILLSIAENTADK